MSCDLDSDVIVLDDDDEVEKSAVSSPVQQTPNYSLSPATATRLRTTALPSNPASATMSPTLIPQMIFTLQNGNAVMVQPQPTIITGTGYRQAMQLVAANSLALPAQVITILHDSALKITCLLLLLP